MSEEHKVVVNEVIQVSGYTYLNVSEKRKKSWLAVTTMQASKGDKLYYTRSMEMTDFFSKELNRTFPSIIFVENITSEPMKGEYAGMMNSSHSAEVSIEKITVSIVPGEGCISIAKLLEAKSEYSGKTVKVKGKIAKLNTAILGKNWIHIQDGTEFNGAFDLTITTDSHPEVGDTVTFEGKLTLKKDFGYGYFYDVIMEDGTLIK
ncbi:MAG: DNA-binding protein [Odoribacter sp.]|nr:DNA-binding protein [Odoribacter sp.]